MKFMKGLILLMFVLQLFVVNATIKPSLREKLEGYLDSNRRHLQATDLDIVLQSYASTKPACLQQLAEDCEELADSTSDPCAQVSEAVFFENAQDPSKGLCYLHIHGSFDATNVNNLMGLDNHEEVETIRLEQKVFATNSGVSCSTQYNAPWGLNKISGTSDQNFQHDPNAGEGVTIYMIDSGICFDCENRPEFAGKIAGHSTFYPQYGNGFDFYGHGTHVAGTLVGETYGIARGAKLFSLRVFDSNGDGYGFAILNALAFVKNQCSSADSRCVINASLGAPQLDSDDLAWNNVAKDGIPCVVAAGNDNADASTKTPANADQTITVGNADSNLWRYTNPLTGSGSNYGDRVDIWAPGTDILSEGLEAGIPAEMTGTSMASPHVAGVVAAIMSRLDKKMNKTEVMEHLNRIAIPNAIQNSYSFADNSFLQYHCVNNGQAKDSGVESSGPSHGGNGGSSFYDKCPNGEYVKAIGVRAGSKVDAIAIRCTNEEWGLWHGGNGGSTAYKFAAYDRFCGASMRTGDLVDKVCLLDNSGSQWCKGGSSGSYFTDDHCSSHDKRKVLVGIAGRSGAQVDRIQFLWKYIECPEFYNLRNFNTELNLDYDYQLQYYKDGFPYYKSIGASKAMWTYNHMGLSTNFIVGKDIKKFTSSGWAHSNWMEGRTCPHTNNGHMATWSGSYWRSVDQSTGEMQESAAIIHGRLLSMEGAAEESELVESNVGGSIPDNWHTTEAAEFSEDKEGCYFFDSEDECQANECVFFNKEDDQHEEGERLFLCWEKNDCIFDNENIVQDCH